MLRWFYYYALLVMATTIIRAEFLRNCHTTDPKPYIYHATKTPYELINREDSSQIFVAGCKPVMFWMAARHGTQYPPAEDVARMKDRLPKLRKTILQNHKERRGTLCQQDVDGLSNNGSIRIDDTFDEALTPTGREELLLLARRFRSRFADFFKEQPEFNHRDYQFRHMKNSKSQASARSFARGLFTGDNVELTEAPVGDKLVDFYQNCTFWKEQVDENEASVIELKRFHQSQTFQNTLADVTTRLGFQYNMSSEDMLLIYDMCRYQKAWNLEQVSPWCAAFSNSNLKVLEFAEDLETYYLQGYGNELNYKQACPLVEDLVSRIRSFKVNGTAEQQRGVFYFMEGQGILRLLARLGLVQDDQPLNHDSSLSPERKWRTSLVGSFAANLVVVLYDCSAEDYKIQLFVKEEVVHLNQCQNALCSYKEFLDFLGPVADRCPTNDGCSKSAVDAPTASLLAISLLVIVNIFAGMFV